MAVECCEFDCLHVLRKYLRSGKSGIINPYAIDRVTSSNSCYEKSRTSVQPEKVDKFGAISNDNKPASSTKYLPGESGNSGDATNEQFVLKTGGSVIVEETLPEYGSQRDSSNCFSECNSDASNTILDKAFCGSLTSQISIDKELCRSPDSTIIFGSEKFSENTDHEIEVVHTDEESGEVLIEKRYPSTYRTTPTNSQDGSNNSYHTPPEEVVPENCNSSVASLDLLCDSELRKRLLDAGDSPGPVTTTTRHVYIARLKNIKSGNLLSPSQSTPLQGYSRELTLIMQKNFSLKDVIKLDEALNAEFDIPDDRKKWREGTQKTCFNYLLLDPNVTQNLPCRCALMSFPEQFTAFVKAIFYVGKGKRNRPYSHLYDAIEIFRKRRKGRSEAKIKTILDIWATGRGIVSLHCFQNTIACEAYTREACMIEALGLENLTNAKKGEFYGPAKRWTSKERKMFGAYLLYRALHVFLYEGERQIRPADIIV